MKIWEATADLKKTNFPACAPIYRQGRQESSTRVRETQSNEQKGNVMLRKILSDEEVAKYIDCGENAQLMYFGKRPINNIRFQIGMSLLAPYTSVRSTLRPHYGLESWGVRVVCENFFGLLPRDSDLMAHGLGNTGLSCVRTGNYCNIRVSNNPIIITHNSMVMVNGAEVRLLADPSVAVCLKDRAVTRSFTIGQAVPQTLFFKWVKITFYHHLEKMEICEIKEPPEAAELHYLKKENPGDTT